MRVHYLEYNGKQYEYGTIVKLKGVYSQYVEGVFFVCDPEEDYYMFAFKDDKCKDGYHYFSYTKKRLKENLIEVTDRIDTRYVQWNPIREVEPPTFKDELAIDGMFLAWVWYVFLMGITLIFNGFPIYWAVISFCFFIYRHGKLKEEGYK